MIHAIETINNSTLLSGVTLGYEIYDTCAEVTKAMASALRFLPKFNSSEDAVEFKCNYSDYIPRVKAVTGASYSEVSMAVSRLLALQLIPQVGLRELFYFGQRFRFTMLRIKVLITGIAKATYLLPGRIWFNLRMSGWVGFSSKWRA